MSTFKYTLNQQKNYIRIAIIKVEGTFPFEEMS